MGDPVCELPLELREAIAWIVRLRSGDATKADLIELASWRARTAAKEAAFVKAARLWGTLKTAATGIEAARKRSSARHFSSSRRTVLAGALAASAAAYIAYDPPFGLWPSLQELNADVRTRKGERREVEIAKGITVSLNTDTSLALLRPDGLTPHIRIISGEAAFTAKSASDVPLRIDALGVEIVASDARFLAQCLEGMVSATCLEGEVEIKTKRKAVRLQKGSGATFSSASGLLTAPADIELASAWQNGLIIARSKPLKDVISEVNRYRRGRILVASSKLGSKLVSGTFHVDKLDEFPELVGRLFNATVRELPVGIVILS